MADKDDKIWVYGLDEPADDDAMAHRPQVQEEWGDPAGSAGRGDRGDGLNPRALLLSVLVGAIIGVSVWAVWLRPDGGPAPIRYEVEAGDSLWGIARRHGVTVDQLKEWNGLTGDTIEVGQVLEIYVAADDAGPAPTASGGRHRRGAGAGRSGSGRGAAPPSPAPEGLAMPPPKPCLTVDEGQLGDHDMVAASGLSYAQTRAALDAFLPTLSRCLEVGEPVSGDATVEVTVGCDGRVQEVQVVDHGDLDADQLDCVRRTLMYAPFPAHDMPDGFTFAYPIHFEF